MADSTVGRGNNAALIRDLLFQVAGIRMENNVSTSFENLNAHVVAARSKGYPPGGDPTYAQRLGRVHVQHLMYLYEIHQTPNDDCGEEQQLIRLLDTLPTLQAVLTAFLRHGFNPQNTTRILQEHVETLDQELSRYLGITATLQVNRRPQEWSGAAEEPSQGRDRDPGSHGVSDGTRVFKSTPPRCTH